MGFAVLGPLTVSRGGHQLDPGPFKQRVVLGLLLCRANQMVSTDALSNALWEGTPPRTARKNLQVYVATVRKLVGPYPGPAEAPVRLLHTPPGYTLCVGPEQLDALRFQELARAGRQAARTDAPSTAAELLGQALELWRDMVLPEMAAVPAIAAEAQRLHERYVDVYEDWAEAKLTLGQHLQVAEGIDELARRYPLRERLRRAQMIALYRCGRQTEALAHFDTVRQMLARELGLQPSPMLTRLYEAILVADPALELADASRLVPVTRG